jgi:hypothetical protein
VETDQCEPGRFAGPSARRSAWYRKLAAIHGRDAAQFADSAWPIDDEDGVLLEVMYAREAAHYALLVMELEEAPCWHESS